MTKPNITMLEGAGGFGTSRERSRRPPVSSETDSSSGHLQILGRGLFKRPVRYRYMPNWTKQPTAPPPLPILSSSDTPNCPIVAPARNNPRPNPLEAVSFFSETSDTCSTRSTTPTAKPDSAYYSEYHPEDGAHPTMPRPPILPYRPVEDVPGSMESQLAETGAGRGGWEGELVTCRGADRKSSSQSSSYGPASDVTDPNHSTSSIPSDDGGSSLTDSVEHLCALSPPSFEDFLEFPGDFLESSTYDLDSVGNSAIISDFGYDGEGELDHHGCSIIDESTGKFQSQVGIQREREGIVLCRPRIHRGNCSSRNGKGLTDSTGTYIISEVNSTIHRRGHIPQSSEKGTEFGRTFHVTSPSQTHINVISQRAQIRSDTIILEKSNIDRNQRKEEYMSADHSDSDMDKPSDIADENSGDAGVEKLVPMTPGNQVKLPALKVTSPRERSGQDDLDLPKGATNFLNVSDLGSECVGGNTGQAKRIQDLDALADNMATKTLMMKIQQERDQQQTEVGQRDVTSQVKDTRQVAMTTNFTHHGDEPASITGIGETETDKQLNTTFVLSPSTSLQQGRQSAFKDSQARQNNANSLSVNMENNDNLDPGPGDNFMMRPSSSTVNFFDQEIPTSGRSAKVVNAQMETANLNNNSIPGEEAVGENISDDPVRNSDTEEGGQAVEEGDMNIRHVVAVMSHQADGPLVGQDVRNTLTVVPAQPEVGDSLNHIVFGLTDEVIATLRRYNADLAMTDNAEDMAPTPPPPPTEPQPQVPEAEASYHEIDEVRASSPHINTANSQQHESAQETEMDNLSEELEVLSSNLVSQVIRRAAAQNEELARSLAGQSSTSGALGVSAGPSPTSPSPIIAKVSDYKSEMGNRYDYEDDFEDEDVMGGGANSSRVATTRSGVPTDSFVSQLEEGEGTPLASVCEQESEANQDNRSGMSPGSPTVKQGVSVMASIVPEQQLDTTTVSKPTQAVSSHKKGSDQGKPGQHSTPGMKQQTHRTVSRTWRPTRRPAPPGESGTSPGEQRAPGGGRYTTQTRKNSRMANSLKTSAAAYGVRERRTKPVGSLSTIKKETHSNTKGDRHSPHPPRTPKLPPVEDPIRTSSESLRKSSPSNNSNNSSRPTLPTFGRPQTIRALGTGARKLRDIEQTGATPESKTTKKEQDREGGKGQPSQGQTYSSGSSQRRPWRQGHSQAILTEAAAHKTPAAMSRRQAQIDFCNKLAARTSANRHKTLPGLPSVLKSDAYWQNGQLHIRVHGPARLLGPDSSAVEGAAQLAGCTEESPTVPLDVRITLVRDNQRRGGNHCSPSAYRGPLADARLGVQSNDNSVTPERTILDTRAVHAQFRTKLARVSAMPRGRLRPLDRASNTTPRQESASSDTQSSK